MPGDKLMDRFAGQARAKKKYRDVVEKQEKKPEPEAGPKALPIINQLYLDILEEDFSVAMATLVKLVKTLELEDHVNFELED